MLGGEAGADGLRVPRAMQESLSVGTSQLRFGNLKLHVCSWLKPVPSTSVWSEQCHGSARQALLADLGEKIMQNLGLRLYRLLVSRILIGPLLSTRCVH